MPRTRSQATSPGGLQALELNAPRKRIGRRAPGKSQPETVSSENNTSSSATTLPPLELENNTSSITPFLPPSESTKTSAAAQTLQTLMNDRLSPFSPIINTSQFSISSSSGWSPTLCKAPQAVYYRDAGVQAVVLPRLKLNPPKPQYSDASTQTEISVAHLNPRSPVEFFAKNLLDNSLTVHTPAKRLRDDSEDETSDEPSAKRHHAMLTPSPAHHTTRTVMDKHRPSRPVQTPRTAPAPRIKYNVHDSYSVLMGHLPKKARPSMFPPTEEDWAAAQANKDAHDKAEKIAAEDARAESIRQAEAALEQAEAVHDSTPPETPRGGLFGSVRNGFGSISRSISKVFKPVLPPVSTATVSDNPHQMEMTPTEASSTTASPQATAQHREARQVHDRLAAELGRPTRPFPSNIFFRPPPTPKPLTQAEIEENLRQEARAIEARVHAETAPKADLKSVRKNNRKNIFANASPLPPKRALHATVEDETPKSPKRKRLPTGPNGEIPPPAGASYGIDDRYIDVDYDSEGSFEDDTIEEETPANKRQKFDSVQTPRSVLKKRSEDGRNLNTAITRSAKRVTFDDSPVDTPTKLRARAGLYTGVHFADKPNEFSDESTLSASDVISPDTTLNTIANTGTQYLYPAPTNDPSFVPTSFHPRPGTFCLDYDTYAEYDYEDEPMIGLRFSGSDVVPSSTVAAEPVTAEPVATKSVAAEPKKVQAAESAAEPPTEPPATPRITHAELPNTTTLTPAASTPALTDLDSEALNKARLTAEKHKPKNPSHLRQAERARTPSPTSDKENEFASLKWPEPQTYAEAGIASQEIVDSVDSRWTDEDEESADFWMDREWPKFMKATKHAEEQGLELEIDIS